MQQSLFAAPYWTFCELRDLTMLVSNGEQCFEERNTTKFDFDRKSHLGPNAWQPLGPISHSPELADRCDISRLECVPGAERQPKTPNGPFAVVKKPFIHLLRLSGRLLHFSGLLTVLRKIGVAKASSGREHEPVRHGLLQSWFRRRLGD